jgi:DNA-binding MarR family transcriptional regulator
MDAAAATVSPARVRQCPDPATSGGPGASTEEARGLSADERAAWLGLLAVVELLPGVLDSQLRRELDLTHFDYHVLTTLAEAAEQGLPMTLLAHHTNASLTRLSHSVTRMEDRRLVERTPSPVDRRVTTARLTSTGRDAVLGATPGHVDIVRRHVLDALTPSQVTQLRCIGEALRQRLGRARHGHPLHDGSHRGSRRPNDPATSLHRPLP